MIKFNTNTILEELKKNFLKNIIIIFFICLVANFFLYRKLNKNYYTVIINLNQSLKFTTKLNFVQKLKNNDISQILDFDGEIKDLKNFIINEINISKKIIYIDPNHTLLNEKSLKLNIDKNYPLEEMLIYINSVISNYEFQEYPSFFEKKTLEPRIFSTKLISYQKNDINYNVIIMLDIFLVVAYFVFFFWSKNISFRITFLKNTIK